MADDRTYIKLHDGMPGHPKIQGLSDKAFRTLVHAWCYCSEYLTDGVVVSAAARKMGTKKTWDEMVAAGVAEDCPDGYLMHDYLEHQRSADEVRVLKERRREAGKKGGRAKATALASARAGASDLLKQTPSKVVAETESLTYVRDQAETNPSLRSGGARKRASRLPDDFAVTDELRTWAQGRGFTDVQIDEITANFARYWQAKPGKDATKLDWPATWQNWVAKEDPARVRAVTSLPSSNGERSWSTAELDAVLGIDMWTCPQPPRDLSPDEMWEWEQRVKREHRAERIAQAEQKQGQAS